MHLLAALVVAVGTESSCTVTAVEGAPDSGEVQLVLRGAALGDWERWCRRLTDYLGALGPFGEAAAERSARRLTATGYFSSASCNVASPRRLDCLMRPRSIVRLTEVGGELPFPLLEREVRRRLFVRPGALLPPEPPLAVQLERLRQHLIRQGYFGIGMELALAEIGDAEPNLGMAVKTTLHGGRKYALGDVDVTGDAVIDPALAEDVLRHFWVPLLVEQRFRPAQLDEDAEALEQMLHEAGYPEARVSGQYALDPREGAVDVALAVSAGRQLLLRFIGNETVQDDELAELATFGEAGVVDAVEVERVRLAIVERLQQEGFYLADVKALLQEPESRLAVVTYVINEGPRAHIDRVRYAGNQTLPTREIRRAVDPLTHRSGLLEPGRWVDAWVERDVRAIREYYHRQGYAEAAVSAERTTLPNGQLEVEVRIEEGTRRLVAHLTLQGVPTDVDGDELAAELPLREGSGFDPTQLDEQERTLLAALGTAGYLTPRLTRDIQAVDGGNVAIEYRIEPGPRSYLGGVLVRGNFRSSPRLVMHELGLSAGDPLDLLEIGAAERRLRDLGVFSSVRLERLEPNEGGETWLLVALEEREVVSLDAVASFTTDELFQVGADLRDRNLFGRGLQVDIGLRLSNASELVSPKLRIGNADWARLHLRAPTLLGLPINAAISGFYDYIEAPLFTELQMGFTGALDRRLRERGGCLFCPEAIGSIGYDLLSTEVTLEAERPEALLDDATVGRVFAQLELYATDAFVDPRRGYIASLRTELAHDLLAPGLTGSSFWRVISSANGYKTLGVPFAFRTRAGQRLGGPVVLALGLSYGAAQPLAGDEVIPESETFFYGGDVSLRGFAQRASTVAVPEGRYLASAKLELRWYFLDNLSIGNLQVAGFVDAAVVSRTAATLFDDPAVGVGPVLRYVTPIGPLTVAYGWPVVRPAGIVAVRPDAAPKGGRLHLVVGPSF